jgi:hypothetical protein
LARSLIEKYVVKVEIAFSDKLFVYGLEEALMPFDLCKLDFMGHRRRKVMVVRIFLHQMRS